MTEAEKSDAGLPYHFPDNEAAAGEASEYAAGAVVSENIPDNCAVGGIPAKKMLL